MTTIDPYHLKIDGEVLATYARGLEVIDGVENIPGRRRQPQYGAYRDGSFPAAGQDLFFRQKTQRIRIWISPFDADGDVTHTNGPRAHLRENLENIMRLIGGKAAPEHTVGWVVPTPTATKELQNTATISAPQSTLGSSRLVRRLDINLDYPHPVWHDVTTGEQTEGPFTGAQSFTPGGTAPLVDAVYTCTAAGKITHDESGHFHEVTAIPGGATSVIIDQRAHTILDNTGADAREYYNSDWGGGLRLDAGAVANLTITGTWQIDHYDGYH